MKSNAVGASLDKAWGDGQSWYRDYLRSFPIIHNLTVLIRVFISIYLILSVGRILEVI